MITVLKSMERNSLKTREEISRLYSLIGNLQRRLDLEYSTLGNDNVIEIIREASPVEEPVIPLFSLLEEKRDKGKNKEESRASQPVLKEILEPKLPDPLLFLLDNRG
ncbi:hypothetical protein ACFX14_013071 [Malus domestica]